MFFVVFFFDLSLSLSPTPLGSCIVRVVVSFIFPFLHFFLLYFVADTLFFIRFCRHDLSGYCLAFERYCDATIAVTVSSKGLLFLPRDLGFDIRKRERDDTWDAVYTSLRNALKCRVLMCVSLRTVRKILYVGFVRSFGIFPEARSRTALCFRPRAKRFRGINESLTVIHTSHLVRVAKWR